MCNARRGDEPRVQVDIVVRGKCAIARSNATAVLSRALQHAAPGDHANILRCRRRGSRQCGSVIPGEPPTIYYRPCGGPIWPLHTCMRAVPGSAPSPYDMRRMRYCSGICDGIIHSPATAKSGMRGTERRVVVHETRPNYCSCIA